MRSEELGVMVSPSGIEQIMMDFIDFFRKELDNSSLHTPNS